MPCVKYTITPCILPVRAMGESLLVRMSAVRGELQGVDVLRLVGLLNPLSHTATPPSTATSDPHEAVPWLRSLGSIRPPNSLIS